MSLTKVVLLFTYHSSLEPWVTEKKCFSYLTMTQSFCIAKGSKWALNQNFSSRAFFSRDRLVFFLMLIRGEIQWKLALLMLWITWNCLEMLLTHSDCSFTRATDFRDPEVFSSMWISCQKLNSKAILVIAPISWGECKKSFRIQFLDRNSHWTEHFRISKVCCTCKGTIRVSKKHF